MRKKTLFVWLMLVLLAGPASSSSAVGSGISRGRAAAFIGQDLHLQGVRFLSAQADTGEHILAFPEHFSMSIGANRFSSDSAVVWLGTRKVGGLESFKLRATVYLQGNISVEKGVGAGTVDMEISDLRRGPSDEAMVVRFGVSGGVFVTADKKEIGEPRDLELYKKALAAVERTKPKFIVQPELPEAKIRVEKPDKEVVTAKPKKTEVIKRAVERKKLAEPEAKEPVVRYPVNIAPAGEVRPRIESVRAADGTEIATVIGRMYLWQRQDENGRLLEMLADNAVVFSSPVARRSLLEKDRRPNTHDAHGDVLAGGAVKAIYMSGDVVVTEGQRTIRADEIYYDFERKKAIAINAVMRNFDVSRGIPIYVRAAELRQLAENKFAAENATLTSSEFYVPQVSMNASRILVTDMTAIDEQLGRGSDSSYDAQMHDVRLKVGDKTIFYWPFVRSNLQRPDTPIKSVHASYDETWGASVETRWYLSRLLGLVEPEGTDGTFALDYYGKRGLGSGAEIDYSRENYFGKVLGYVIRDTGEDDLGRLSSRRGLKPERELRGRFYWQHRQFLPYDWQLTSEFGYASDENFIEQYYRSEFNVGKQETYIHLKRLQDNWAVSLLGEGRINDFADELEELPCVEFHLTGQSLFNDMFTLYSDTEIGRLRQRIGDDHSTVIGEQRFSFVSHRAELDMPLKLKTQKLKLKIVPFMAGTFGYDDRSGFTRTLVDGSNTGSFGDDKVWLGEAGVRVGTQYWKRYPNVKSRLWDLNGLRHIIRPELTGVLYEQSDSVVEQRDMLNIGISQRLQTKRGPEQRQRSVDWMRLDTDVTWVNNSSDSICGPDRFIWNRPSVPLRVLSAPDIFNGDLTDTSLRRIEQFGPSRNYFGADYIWRVSDTTAVLSDINFDMQAGVVQQFNVGLTHLRWPNLNYYIGSRYLRRAEVLDEKGSNVFTLAATYAPDERYTFVFSQQFDFDYGENCRSDITLIRRYHRVYCGLTFSSDESLDRQRIIFSIWPQGVPELAIGQRRYMGLGR